jgi:hypothetical protein
VTGNAPFCANCGAALTGPLAAKKPFWLGVLVAVGAMGLAVAGLSMSGLLRFKAPEAPQGPIAKATEVTPPVVRSNDPMPEDVRAWLEHLRRIEEKRIELAQSQIMGLLVGMEEIKGAELGDALSDILGGDPTEGEQTEAPSVGKARDIANEVRPKWKELAAEFEAKAPPEECQSIAGEYDQALRETGATVSDIIDVINNEAGEPQSAIEKLRGIMTSHKKMIDEPAKRTDDGVARICDKYGVRKWFEIKGDVGGGGLFAMPSIPMPGIGQ